jgi:hypothetical protein
VIVSRTLLAVVPDRAGAARILGSAVLAEAAVAIAALLVLTIGQGLVVPALGIPPARPRATARPRGGLPNKCVLSK